MYNNKRKNIVNTDKVVTVYVNLAVDSKCDFGHYKNRGIIIYNFIEYLIEQKNIEKGYKVNLKLVDATFVEGETIIQKFEEIIFKKNRHRKSGLLYSKRKNKIS